MAIRYNKLFELLKEKGLTMYSLRKNKIVGTETLEKMRKGTGHIDDRSINRLCEYLNCQPGDIMEYVEDSDKDKFFFNSENNYKKHKNNNLI